MIFTKHKYFSSEDLDFRNLTKFILHFYHFSSNYQTFSQNNKNKNKNYPNLPPLPDSGPHPAVGQGGKGGAPLLCPRAWPLTPAARLRGCSRARPLAGRPEGQRERLARRDPHARGRAGARAGQPRAEPSGGVGAAARGGGAVPAVAGQEDRGMGRRDGEGCSAVSGRAAAVSRLARGRRAACASGE